MYIKIAQLYGNKPKEMDNINQLTLAHSIIKSSPKSFSEFENSSSSSSSDAMLLAGLPKIKMN